ncbi:MAG: hypothetical protein LQ339_003583 [Xanthoria mediterranea]|nr:MAG: hypothetical protein LQ339_003583 [Xanthoria mediterranea]
MADPLSIAAGVIGILVAAAHISSLLFEFTSTSKDVPQSARAVLTEVNDIKSTLEHLGSFLSGNECSDKSRTELLQVHQVVTIMSGCVLTFSELERVLDGLKAEGMVLFDRARWARKEKVIGNLVQRLQNHKASLSLILHVLNGYVGCKLLIEDLELNIDSNTILEAKSSVDRLHATIERCYQEMSSRIEALELRNGRSSDGYPLHHRSESDTSSVMTIEGPKSVSSKPERASNTPNGILASEFTEILRKTWVYRRNKALDVSGSSLYSRDTCSMTWSCLSDLSWAEVSNISVIDLPISVDEVHNPLRSSQTWSKNTVDPVWPVTSPVGLAANTQAAAKLPTHGPAVEPPAFGVDIRDSDVDLSPWESCSENTMESRASSHEQNSCHLNRSRCKICDTLLHSGSSPVILGDGSLICNNCASDCNSCGKKMEGPTILTGDLAFSAGCLQCHNCAMKIADFKYARTSQGRVFWMKRYDTRMACRRRKFSAPASPFQLPEMQS